MDTEQPSPLQPILDDIVATFDADLYYVAISLSLSIPDICSSLTIGKDEKLRFRRIKKRYVAWCKKYLEPHFIIFTGEDCWALRGGVVHNGMLFGHPQANYDRLYFTLPSSSVLHENLTSGNAGVEESALQLDAKIFCETMINAAQNWLQDVKDDETVRENIPNIVRFRPDGLWPHMTGGPVIA